MLAFPTSASRGSRSASEPPGSTVFNGRALCPIQLVAQHLAPGLIYSRLSPGARRKASTPRPVPAYVRPRLLEERFGKPPSYIPLRPASCSCHLPGTEPLLRWDYVHL